MENHWLQSVHSDGSKLFVKPARPKISEQIQIRLRVFKNTPLHKIYLRMNPEGEQVLVQMFLEHEDTQFAWYSCNIQVVCARLNYRFMLADTNQIYWFNQAGIHEYDPGDRQDFIILADWVCPDWLQSSIFYQIFPDTFRRSSTFFDPKIWDYEYQGHKPLLRQWTDKPREYQLSHSMDFFGGDIAGIEQSIDYLKELGINAIYLNPIFSAPSNHRYDIQDYFQVDPKLGTNESFAQFVKKLHSAGIHIILDGIFNHCGIAHRWFNLCQYYPEPGAYQDIHSPFYKFFTFTQHPTQYACWQDVPSLPKLNYRCQQLRDVIYRNADSAMQFWLRPPYEIDGWRLDVANMMARQDNYQAYQEVFAEMRHSIKSQFANSYLLGEHFFDASDLLQGNAMDAVMNYWGFALPLRQWITGISHKNAPCKMSAIHFDQQTLLARSLIPFSIANSQYNLLNSHDIPRLLHVTKTSSTQDLAMILLFTYLGTPSIYYGDEIGLGNGASAERARKPMVWERADWNQTTWQKYRTLIQMRKSHLALQEGGFKTLLVNDQVYSFARFTQDEIIIVVLNHGPAVHVKISADLVGISAGQKLLDMLGQTHITAQENGQLHLSLSENSGLILKA